MACDICTHIELKLNSRWLHWNEVTIVRDYPLFAKLAGVHDSSIAPVALPRGLPQDASELSRLCFDRPGRGAHTASWLLAAEAGRVQQWFDGRLAQRAASSPLWGTVLGNPIDAQLKWKDIGEAYVALGIQDVRVVFWFEG